MATTIAEIQTQAPAVEIAPWKRAAWAAFRVVRQQQTEAQAEFDRQAAEKACAVAEANAAGFRKALYELIGVDVEIAPGQTEIELDGMFFRCWNDGKSIWAARRCITCGKEFENVQVKTLADLGRVWGTVSHPYDCIADDKAEPAPDPDAKAGRTIEELLALAVAMRQDEIQYSEQANMATLKKIVRKLLDVDVEPVIEDGQAVAFIGDYKVAGSGYGLKALTQCCECGQDAEQSIYDLGDFGAVLLGQVRCDRQHAEQYEDDVDRRAIAALRDAINPF